MRFLETFQTADFIDTLVSLSAAFVLGTLIGAERQYRLRSAGLRTNVLVAVGAAAFVDLAMHLAAACQVPTVGVFGPSIDWQWSPWKCPHLVCAPPAPPNGGDLNWPGSGPRSTVESSAGGRSSVGRRPRCCAAPGLRG